MGVTNQKHPQEGPRSGSRKESGEVTSSLALLICCEDALRLYPLKSVIEVIGQFGFLNIYKD